MVIKSIKPAGHGFQAFPLSPALHADSTKRGTVFDKRFSAWNTSSLFEFCPCLRCPLCSPHCWRLCPLHSPWQPLCPKGERCISFKQQQTLNCHILPQISPPWDGLILSYVMLQLLISWTTPLRMAAFSIYCRFPLPFYSNVKCIYMRLIHPVFLF